MPSVMLDDSETIDPEVARFVAAILRGSALPPGAPAPTLAEQRARSETVRERWRQGGPMMRQTRDIGVPTPAGAVRVRLFEPDDRERDRPALIYVHGGGFVLFSLDTHDRLMREYAAGSGAVVIGVDYALSPEARFPVALHQIAAVTEWAHREAGALGLDPRRIAIGGDSAGANLALATTLLLRARGAGSMPAALLFNYGFFDADFSTGSQQRHGGPGKLLTTDELDFYLDAYLGEGAERTDPLALPALAALHELPPSLHVIAPCDPLADGDRAMAARMRAAGNDVTVREYPGATHSFLEAVSISAVAERALAESGAWLRATLTAQPVAAD